MRIKSVSIENFHNVRKRTYEFDSNATYLTGRNGAGKSTVLNAIQLALLGYIPGSAKGNSSIMEHCNGSELRVSVDVEREDGSVLTVSRSFRRKGAGATSSVSTVPDNVDVDSLVGNLKLPIFDWSEFVGMTGNKLKDWFIQFMPGSQDSIDWSKELSEGCDVDANLVEQYAAKLESVECDSVVDQVSKANAALKSDLSYVKTVVKEKQSALNGILESQDSLYETNKLTQKLSSINKSIKDVNSEYLTLKSRWTDLSNEMHRQQAALAEYSRVKASYDSMRSLEEVQTERLDSESSLKEAVEFYEEFRLSKKDCDSKVRDVSEKLADARAEESYLSKVATCDGVCPYLGKPCETLDSAKQEYSSKLKQAKQTVADLAKEQSDLERSAGAFEEEMKLWYESQATCRLALQTLDEEARSIQRISEQLKSLNVPEDENLVAEEEVLRAEQLMEECRSKALALKDEASAVERQIESAKLIDSLQDQLEQLKLKENALNCWVKLTSANGIQTRLSASGFSSLESSLTTDVKSLFGDNCCCKFNVQEKANSFSFGLERSGSYIPYNLLSTGEKTLYTFALMSYIAKNSNSKLHLVLMDDFFDHLDSERFDSLLKFMSCCSDVQVIMAGVANCASDLVNVVEVE